MNNRLMSGLGALLIFGVGQQAAANGFSFGPGVFVTVSDMAVFPNGPAVVGASIMTRDLSGVEATIDTTGLEAGAGYSWWWVVFNNPQYCRDGCGLDDLPPGTVPPAAGDLRVRASLLWGGGFIAKADGSGQAGARLERGQPPGEVRFGPGLLNVQQAEIHIVLRTHGPAAAGEVAALIGSFDGGCTPEEVAAAQCPNANKQFAVHQGRAKAHPGR